MLFVLVLLLSYSSNVCAENWRAKHSKVTLGICTLEKKEEITARCKHLVEYLEKETGVDVLLHTSPDYATMISDMNAGKVDLMSCGLVALIYQIYDPPEAFWALGDISGKMLLICAHSQRDTQEHRWGFSIFSRTSK